jgi:hypothetical protein
MSEDNPEPVVVDGKKVFVLPSFLKSGAKSQRDIEKMMKFGVLKQCGDKYEMQALPCAVDYYHFCAWRKEESAKGRVPSVPYEHYVRWVELGRPSMPDKYREFAEKQEEETHLSGKRAVRKKQRRAREVAPAAQAPPEEEEAPPAEEAQAEKAPPEAEAPPSSPPEAEAPPSSPPAEEAPLSPPQAEAPPPSPPQAEAPPPSPPQAEAPPSSPPAAEASPSADAQPSPPAAEAPQQFAAPAPRRSGREPRPRQLSAKEGRDLRKAQMAQQAPYVGPRAETPAELKQLLSGGDYEFNPLPACVQRLERDGAAWATDQDVVDIQIAMFSQGAQLLDPRNSKYKRESTKSALAPDKPFVNFTVEDLVDWAYEKYFQCYDDPWTKRLLSNIILWGARVFECDPTRTKVPVIYSYLAVERVLNRYNVPPGDVRDRLDHFVQEFNKQKVSDAELVCVTSVLDRFLSTAHELLTNNDAWFTFYNTALYKIDDAVKIKPGNRLGMIAEFEDIVKHSFLADPPDDVVALFKKEAQLGHELWTLKPQINERPMPLIDDASRNALCENHKQILLAMCKGPTLKALNVHRGAGGSYEDFAKTIVKKASEIFIGRPANVVTQQLVLLRQVHQRALAILDIKRPTAVGCRVPWTQKLDVQPPMVPRDRAPRAKH